MRSAIDAVGDHKLQEEAPEHPQQTVLGSVEVKALRLLELAEEIPGPFDRSGDQLGEKGYKQRVAQEIPLRRDIPAVYVHRIADGLESKEGNSRGEQDIENWDAEPDMQRFRQMIKNPGTEGKILKKEQRGEGQDNGHGEDRFSPDAPLLPGAVSRRGKQKPAAVCDRRDVQKQQEEASVPTAVEEIARQQQPEGFHPFGDDIINKDNYREKNQKPQRVE